MLEFYEPLLNLSDPEHHNTSIRTIDRNELISLADDLITEEDHDITYILCCPVCGEEIQFKFFGDKMIKKCSNQHSVPSMFCKKDPSAYNQSNLYNNSENLK